MDDAIPFSTLSNDLSVAESDAAIGTRINGTVLASRSAILALILGAGLWAFGAGPAAAQEQLPARRIAPQVVEKATDVHSADLDGDGNPDVISASFGDNKIAWHENQTDGEGGFSAQRTISKDAINAQSVDAADLDGDGDQDVLSASSGDDKIAWYENRISEGEGFSDQRVINTPDTDLDDFANGNANGAESVYAADLDGDGDQDVLSASKNDDKIAWYENLDSGGFSGQKVINTPASGFEEGNANGAESVYAADLDGDGDQDVLSASKNDDKIAWYENLNSGGFFRQKVINTEESGFEEGNADGASSVYAIDLDGDGDQDVLSASENDDKVAWHENLAGEGGGFSDQKVISTKADGAESVYAADLNGDGDPDVLSASLFDDSIMVYDNKLSEGGEFDELTITTNALEAEAVFAKDLDGDGNADVLSASIDDDKIAWYESLAGEGGGFSAQKTIVPSGFLGSPQTIHAADLDGDGDRDALSASSDSNQIAWHENLVEQGKEFARQKLISIAVDFPTSIHAADLDGDGDQDVLSASFDDDKIAWYENRLGKGGGFVPKVINTSASEFGNGNADGATSVYAADLDGDGDQDVLSASENDGKIAWHENLIGEGGGFSDQKVISTKANGAQSVYAADLDEDGDQDVLSASEYDVKIAWYENLVVETGGFTKQKAISSTNASEAKSVYAADLDGDGDPDVVSGSNSQVAWHENQLGEGGEISSAKVISTTFDPNSVSARDLDGDETPEVLAAGGRTVAWYQETVSFGSRTFDEKVVSSSVDNVSSLFPSDLNGDSSPDILVTSTGDLFSVGTVIRFRNNFAPAAAAPAAPPGLTAEATADSVRLSWTAPSGLAASNVARYRVYRSVRPLQTPGQGGPPLPSPLATTTETAYTDTTSLPRPAYRYHVTAVDSAGNESSLSEGVRALPGQVAAADTASVGLGDGRVGLEDGLGATVELTGVTRTGELEATRLKGRPIDQTGITESNVGVDRFALEATGGLAFDSSTVRVPVTSIAGAEDLSAVTVYKRDTVGVGRFSEVATRVDDAGTPSNVSDDTLVVGIRGFSEFAFASGSEPLPVEIARFEATLVQEDGASSDGKSDVRLTWRTASETRNAGFAIERKSGSGSATNSGWTKVGFVKSKAKGGTASEPLRYQFTDSGLPFEADSLSYRLRQVDADGSASYSKSVTIGRTASEVRLLKTYPNPARTRATVRYAVPGRQKTTLRLYDVLGRRVRTIISEPQRGRREQVVDVSGLPSGIYFLRLRAGDATRTRKLTVLR